jgi:hypothetical protein
MCRQEVYNAIRSDYLNHSGGVGLGYRGDNTANRGIALKRKAGEQSLEGRKALLLLRRETEAVASGKVQI